MELPPCVRPASQHHDAGFAAQGVVAVVAVGLHIALEAGKIGKRHAARPRGVILIAQHGPRGIPTAKNPHVGFLGVGTPGFLKHLHGGLIDVDDRPLADQSVHEIG